MWIRKLRVVNVGRFEDFSVDLARGSVGIFGKNGSGKSTLLNLMYGLVTNDFTRFPGVKADMVRNTADPKAESYLRGEVEHNGTVLDITRNFRTTKARPNTVLTVGAGEAIADANKAQAAIYEALGVDGRLLDLYAFKEQHKVYDFLTSVPSERARAYATLCRTEACEAAWDMLGQFLNKDKELNTEVVDDSDELTQAIGELEAEAAALAARRAEAEGLLCADKHRAAYEKRIKDADRRGHLLEEEARLVQDVEAAAGAAKKYKKALAAAAEELTVARDRHDKRKSKADDTRAALKAWDAYKAYRRQRKRLAEERDALVLEENTTQPPTAPDETEGVDAIQHQLLLAEGELAQAKTALAAFRNTGLVACPTCATPVANLKAHLSSMQDAAHTLPGKIKKLEARAAAVEAYRAGVRKYEKWRAGYEARATANAAALAALSTVEAPDGEADELAAWLEKFEKVKAALAEADDAHRKAERQFERADADLRQKQTRLEEVRRKAAEIEVDPAKLDKARRRLAEHLTAANDVAAVTGELKGVARQVEAKKEALKRLRARLKRTRRVRQMARVVAEAREVLHRDRLPRRVAETNLARMEGDVNDNLALFGDPFWVEASPDLSFAAHKPGEPPQAAGRLSTGQRVVLALAFWPAVASLWSAELGMLALDEPTANLDADNRKFLRDAIGVMTAKVRGARQLVMVTHDRDLQSAFDQVIDLGG